MEEIYKEEKGEISFALIKWDVKKRGIPNKREIQKHIQNASKSTGFAQEKIRAFYIELFKDIHEDITKDLMDLNLETPVKTRSTVGFRNCIK